MGEQANYRPGTNPGPPWPTVVATTVRLWLRRGTRGTLFRRHRVAALTVLAATALVAGGLAIALTRQAGAAPASGVEAAQGGAGPVARSPIPTGQYTVAMRDSGAPANTPPTLSASVQVTPGMA